MSYDPSIRPPQHGGYYPPPPKRGMSTGAKVALWLVLGTVVLCGLGGLVVLIAGGAAVNEAVKDFEATSVPGQSISGNTAAPGVSSKSANTENPPQNDVINHECARDELGHIEAHLTVKNNSSKRSRYTIEVIFTTPDGGTRIDDATAFVNSLDPGQQTTVKAITFTEHKAAFSCKVQEVNRYAA